MSIVNVQTKFNLQEVHYTDRCVQLNFTFNHSAVGDYDRYLTVEFEGSTISDILVAKARNSSCNRSHLVAMYNGPDANFLAGPRPWLCDVVYDNDTPYIVLFDPSDHDHRVQIELTKKIVNCLGIWMFNQYEPKFSLGYANENEINIRLFDTVYGGKLTNDQIIALLKAVQTNDYWTINHTEENPIEGEFFCENGDMYHTRTTFHYDKRNDTVYINVDCYDFDTPETIEHGIPVNDFAYQLERVINKFNVELEEHNE